MPPAPWRLILTVAGRGLVDGTFAKDEPPEARAGTVITQLRALGTTFTGQEMDESGPPLHTAIATGLVEVARYLLVDKGVDPDRGDRFGCTPLLLASTLPMLELLVEHGADVNLRGPAIDGLLPLQQAMLETGTEGVRLLHGRGARLDAALDDGRFLGTLIDRHGEVRATADEYRPPAEAQRVHGELRDRLEGLFRWLDSMGVDLTLRISHRDRSTTVAKLLDGNGFSELVPWLASLRARRAALRTLQHASSVAAAPTG